MRRRLPRPFGSSITAARCFSLVLMLAVLWMIYDGVRQPATWRWLASAEETRPEAAPPEAPAPESAAAEMIVPGPTDLDQDSQEEMQSHFRFVSDRTPLRSREMPAYWALMAWSLAQSQSELEERAQPEPAVSQLWEKPGDFRGKPLRLKLHVRRVLEYEAPQNSLGLKKVYEVWGWTDLSRSFPYVVVVPELPPGFPVGPDVTGEAVFTGYFLKIMAFQAFDNARGAPLLLGRLRKATPGGPRREPLSSSLNGWPWALGVGVVIVAGALAGLALRTKKRPPLPASLPGDFSLEGFGAPPEDKGPVVPLVIVDEPPKP